MPKIFSRNKMSSMLTKLLTVYSTVWMLVGREDILVKSSLSKDQY